jgi:hypothetical protein
MNEEPANGDFLANNRIAAAVCGATNHKEENILCPLIDQIPTLTSKLRFLPVWQRSF